MRARRWMPVALLVVLALLLTACNVGPKAPSAPGRPPVTLLHPDALPPGATETAAYRTAVERGMLLCGEQPATDGALVWWFLGEVEAGREVELCVATFTAEEAGERAVVIDRFESRSDGVYLTTANLPSWSDAGIEFDTEGRKVEGITLNDYGCLVYDTPELSGPFGVQVLHDRELYTNHDEAAQVYETYLRPILYTALGGAPWNSPEELGRWVWLYEDISNYEGQNPFDLYGSDWPVEAILSTLNRYFEEVTRENLPLADYGYHSETDTIHYEGGRGGGPKLLRVLDWAERGDLLEICYVGYDTITHVPHMGEYLLTVRRAPDGSFRYLANTHAPYVNRLKRDALLDPEQLLPHQNSAYVAGDRPGGPWLELDYGAQHISADLSPLGEQVENIDSLLGVFVTHPKTAIALGGGSEAGVSPVTVLISEDMGATWAAAQIPDSANPERNWDSRRIGFTTLDAGWLLLSGTDPAGGEHARLYTTSDGGKSWSSQALPQQEGRPVCCFVSPAVGFLGYYGEDASGPPLWRTTDGGQSWERLTLSLQEGQTPEWSYIGDPILYTRNRIDLPVVMTVNGMSSARMYRSWDGGKTWRFPVRMPPLQLEAYGAVTVTAGGSPQPIEHPYERHLIEYALQNLIFQNCIAVGEDPQALLPGYGALERMDYLLTGPREQWEMSIYLGEAKALVWQSGDSDRYYLMERRLADDFLQECQDAKAEAVLREHAVEREDYANPDLRRSALAMGYSEEYLDFLLTSADNRYGISLLAQDGASVLAMMEDFQRVQAFINKLLGMSWDRLGVETGMPPVFTPDGNRGVFFCYSPDEYASPGYMIWCNRQTGETKYLGTTRSEVRVLDTKRGLLLLSAYSDIATVDVHTGERVPTVYPFDFGRRLADGEPQRVVRGLGYDGFADRLVVFYTDNPYGGWRLQTLRLAVFEGGGQHLRDVDTGLVISSYHKNFPVTASFVSFTADGRIRSDFITAGPLDMEY